MNEKNNMEALDSLIRDVWFGWQEENPEQWETVEQALAEGIGSMRLIEEVSPPRIACYLVWHDIRQAPLFLFEFEYVQGRARVLPLRVQ